MTGSLARMWFGAFGGLAAWSAHLFVGYALIASACAGGPSVSGPAGVNAAFIGLTIALAGVAGAATWAALRTFRAGPGWRRFLGFLGVFMSGLALATILLGGTLPIALPACA